jgi:hypothetical protein
LIAIIEIASNASSVFDRKAITPRKPESWTKTYYYNLRSLDQNKIHPMKKEATQNARGSKQRHLMKKEATTKRKGLKTIDL